MVVVRAHVKEQGTGAVFQRLYEQLNEEQRQAVDQIEGPMMVLAGPGTGKTQVLAMRIANILQKTQMDPWNILCLTFTESGVSAMRKRLLSIIGEAAYYIRIHTFHSFCNEIMQEFPEKFAATREWQVLSDIERVELFEDLISQLPAQSILKPFGNPHAYLTDAVRAVQDLKKEGWDPNRFRELLESMEKKIREVRGSLEAFISLKHTERTDADCEAIQQTFKSAGFGGVPEFVQGAAELAREAKKARTAFKNEIKSWFEKMQRNLPRQMALQDVYARYQEALIERGRYDFEDMIMQVVSALEGDAELLAQYQEQFQYILVDEYQDTNSAQNKAVYLLGSFFPDPNIFVVGDDKQSIFRFQGASLENLLSFYEQYRAYVRVVTLTNNYRSQQTILDAALAVIEHNKESVARYIPHVTQALTAVGEKTSYPLEERVFDTEEQEHYFVSTKIQELVKSGVNPGEIAVLFRNNRDSEALVDVLLRQDIPVRLAAGEHILAQPRIQQLLDVFRFVSGVGGEEILARIIEFDFMGIDSLDAMKTLFYKGAGRRSLFQLISNQSQLEQAGVVQGEALVQLARNLATWKKVAANNTLQHAFDIILQESGLLTYVLEGEDRLPLLNDLTTLFSFAKEMNRTDHRMSLAAFVGRLDSITRHGLTLSSQEWQTHTDAVSLMTAHKSKGLEFEHVFLIGLIDRHWGNVRQHSRLPLPRGIVTHDPIVDGQRNEDERRLFYVALTRAKKQVYLSHARQDGSRAASSHSREHVPSIFLGEIPSVCLQRHSTDEIENEALQRLNVLRLTPVRYAKREDIKAWLHERLESYVMSVTHLNNYLACPRKFYYMNLLRVPAAPTKHMLFGTAVHAALRDFFERAHESVVPGKQYLLERFQKHLVHQVLTDNDLNDSLELGQQALASYYSYYADTFSGDALLEYDFRDHGVILPAKVPIQLTGKLDKVEFLSKKRKTVNVVDYKTGNPDNAGAKLRKGGDYVRQLVFYKVLCMRSPRFAYTMESGEIDFIQPSARFGKHIKRRVHVSSEDVSQLEEEILHVWSEIRALRFLDEGAGCGECEYCVV